MRMLLFERIGTEMTTDHQWLTIMTLAGHDSSITIVDCGSLDQHTKKTNVLPFSAILFIDETNIIAGGYNFVPYKVSAADGVPVLGDSIDKGKTEKKATKTQSDSQKAMSMFVNQDKLGTKSAVATLDSYVKARHDQHPKARLISKYRFTFPFCFCLQEAPSCYYMHEKVQ